MQTHCCLLPEASDWGHFLQDNSGIQKFIRRQNILTNGSVSSGLAGTLTASVWIITIPESIITLLSGSKPEFHLSTGNLDS